MLKMSVTQNVHLSKLASPKVAKESAAFQSTTAAGRYLPVALSHSAGFQRLVAGCAKVLSRPQQERCPCLYSSKSDLSTSCYLYRPMAPRTTYRPEQPQLKLRIAVHPTQIPYREGSFKPQPSRNPNGAGQTLILFCGPGRRQIDITSACASSAARNHRQPRCCAKATARTAKMACCHMFVVRHHVLSPTFYLFCFFLYRAATHLTGNRSRRFLDERLKSKDASG